MFNDSLLAFQGNSIIFTVNLTQAMNTLLRLFIVAITTAFITLGCTSCQTTQGMGRDIQQLGSTMERKINGN